jgi:hypothetical protein
MTLKIVGIAVFFLAVRHDVAPRSGQENRGSEISQAFKIVAGHSYVNERTLPPTATTRIVFSVPYYATPSRGRSWVHTRAWEVACMRRMLQRTRIG